jgi:ATP-dependent 26S proteasome regulatory subunit
MDQIQAEADRIFSMLAEAERVVVLLDEFDEMVRERQEASEVLSRFLTTAMLPKLAAISKRRRIVFIVATNFIDHFDIAIRRPGRFDALLQVMTPTAQEKLKHWNLKEDFMSKLLLQRELAVVACRQ